MEALTRACYIPFKSESFFVTLATWRLKPITVLLSQSSLIIAGGGGGLRKRWVFIKAVPTVT
jgi:hypothetical protein